MKRSNRRERIRNLTTEALDGYARNRADRERRRDQPARPGDLFVMAETAAFPVEWAILKRDPDDPDRLLAVAADLNPLAGRADVVAAAGATGPLSLRCGLAVWLGRERFDPARRTGFLAPELLDRARRKQAEIGAGTLAGSILEQETESEPGYRDWLEEVLEKARAALLEPAPGRREEAGSELPTGAVRAHLRPARRSWGNPYAIAASVLLVVTLGLLAGLAQQHRENAALEREIGAARSARPLVNLPLAVFGTGGTLRGQVQTVTVPAAASHLLLLFEVHTAYPAYRLEILPPGADVPAWSSGELTRVGMDELSVALPRPLFAAGDHRLRLYGLSGGETTLLVEHALRVEVE